MYGFLTDSRVGIPSSYRYHGLAACCDLVFKRGTKQSILGKGGQGSKMVLLEIPIPRRVWGHPPRETLRLHKVVCEASSSRLAQLFKKNSHEGQPECGHLLYKE